MLVLESPSLDARVHVRPKVRITPHPHRALSEIVFASQMKLGMIDEGYAIVVWILQPELDVSAAAALERLDRIFVLPANAFHLLGQLGESLLAHCKQQGSIVFK